MKTLAKAIFVIAICLLSTVTIVKALTVNYQAEPQEEELFGGSGFELSKTSMASSSVTTTGDTAEMIFDVGSAESIDLYVTYVASSTLAQLDWTYYFSFAGEEEATTWYAEDGKTVSTNVLATHGATPFVHSWLPATTTTQMKDIGVTPIAANKMKVVFSGSAANGMVSAVAVRKNERN